VVVNVIVASFHESSVPEPGVGLWLIVLLLGIGIVGLAVLASRSARLHRFLERVGGRSLRARLLRDRRRRLLASPFPMAWEHILRRNFGLYAHLSPAERMELQKVIRVLVAEKEWTGCRGMRITDEVRVTISAAAALLILAREHDYYENARSILVYPSVFEMPAEQDESGLVPREGEQLLGQAWYRGPIILAWDEVLRDCRHPFSGRNVVYHEFAHELDYEGASLSSVGTEDEAKWRRFGTVMKAEYQALV
jgi:Mlc titration factor MtfA (ptsG expression regulator)